MTNVTISRELLERVTKTCMFTMPADDYTELRAALAAPATVQGDAVTLRFPTMLRKMWSGGEVQDWLDSQGPLYTTPPQPADVEELASDLKFLADYVWRERCGLSLPNYQALGRFPLDVAEAALAKLDPQPNSKPKETP